MTTVGWNLAKRTKSSKSQSVFIEKVGEVGEGEEADRQGAK